MPMSVPGRPIAGDRNSALSQTASPRCSRDDGSARGRRGDRRRAADRGGVQRQGAGSDTGVGAEGFGGGGRQGAVAAMIPVPSGVRVWLAVGHTGKLAKSGKTITETLEAVPRQWKVIQTEREKFTCR